MGEMSVQQALEAALEHHRAGRLQEAESICRQVLSRQPNQPVALHLLGYIAYKLGQLDAAIDLIGRSVGLVPDDPGSLRSLANALAARGRLDEAITHLNRALELRPNNYELLNNLALALANAGRWREAAARFEQVLGLFPDLAEAHSNYSIVLRDQGLLTQAVAHARRAVELKPDFVQSYSNLALALLVRGQCVEAVAVLRHVLDAHPNYLHARSNLLLFLHHESIDPAALLAEHQRWAGIHARPLYSTIRPHQNSPDPDRVLRIGYVSPDFRAHVVASFIEPVLLHHDRGRFEVFGYSDTLCPDEVTQKLAGSVSVWRSIAGLSDERAAELIRDDRIDILVELFGHTRGDRLLIFARKPAPIQVSYLGYPDTTGLSTIDYRLTDAAADPPGQTERWHTEKLLRMPHTAWCYPVPAAIPPVNSRPRSGPITFGSFNALRKFSDTTLDLWTKILHAVQDSRLLVKAVGLEDDQTRALLAGRLRARGIATDRFELLGKAPTLLDHLATYHRLDIALDSFPYHGTTTTCEALYMGVPVVTLAGKTHVSRVGASLLATVGLPDLIAQTPDQFVSIAAKLAHDRARLAILRAGLREQACASPLADAAAFTRNLEEAYRGIWREWCATRPVKSS